MGCTIGASDLEKERKNIVMNDLEKLVPVADANSQNEHTPPNNKIIQLRTSKTIRDMPPIDWLIDGVLPEKKVSIIYGPYGAYKSFLCLDWAAHVVLGKSWHGH